VAPGVGGFKSPPAVLVRQGKVVEEAVLFSTWRGEFCLPVLSSHTGCPKRHLIFKPAGFLHSHAAADRFGRPPEPSHTPWRY